MLGVATSLFAETRLASQVRKHAMPEEEEKRKGEKRHGESENENRHDKRTIARPCSPNSDADVRFLKFFLSQTPP